MKKLICENGLFLLFQFLLFQKILVKRSANDSLTIFLPQVMPLYETQVDIMRSEKHRNKRLVISLSFIPET
ncbi:MAG: hypothetical protein DI535_09515 [Citrobacter freundii]|nr:MAG: hypothetical protein DI535_09515 [Citrobacter freundii]